MPDTPADARDDGLPPSLRLLKHLVTALTVTLILGVIAMVFVLVTRLPGAATLPRLPDNLTLPAGAAVESMTFGKGWIGVVTTDGRFLLFAATGGAPLQEVRLTLPDGG